MKRSTVIKQPDHAIALDDFIPFNLGVIFNQVSRDMARIYRGKFGIGLTEGRIIITLASRPNMGVNELGKMFGVDKAVISRAVAELVRKGLVDVNFDPTNARRKFLSLTRRGWTVNGQAVPLVYEVQRELLSLVSRANAKELRRLLVALRQALDRRENGSRAISGPID